MSEAWHEHLNHLSFWEQLDRLWNPSKYSCTNTFNGLDLVWHIFLVSIFVCVGVSIVLLWLRRREKKTV